MNKVYIVSKRKTWADHRRSDGYTKIIAMTENIFTAYAYALESWLEQYIERILDYDEDHALEAEIAAKISSTRAADLESLHKQFLSYAEENWRNEYGGDISFSVQIEVKSLSKHKKSVDIPSTYKSL